jgi:hypothetical protein
LTTFLFTSACGNEGLTSEREDVAYEDVDIDSITAPPSSARGARDFLQSGEGIADGEPLYIAWLNENPDWDVSLRAASELVNRELNGVNGRPIEILSCENGADLQTCAEHISELAPVITLIGETATAHETIRKALGNTPAIGVDPKDPQSWNDPLTHHFALGTTGVLRAAATWAATRPAEETYDAMLILAPYDQALEGTLDALKTAQVDTLILGEEAARDAENTIAAALDNLGDAPKRRTLVVNSLGQNGCVSLARTVDPRVASPSWGTIDVITTGACAGKQVHDELGDWPPNWYHVGAGPDLQIYELDPQVRVYRDRITRYGKPDADWTAANSLPFATLLTALRIITPVVNDNPTPTGNDVNRAVASYTGPGFMGMPEHQCGFDSNRTSLCVRHARVFLYTGQRDWLNLVGEPFPLTN